MIYWLKINAMFHHGGRFNFSLDVSLTILSLFFYVNINLEKSMLLQNLATPEKRYQGIRGTEAISARDFL